MDHAHRNRSDLLIAGAAALAGLLFCNPLRFGLPLTAEELSWLDHARGAAPSLADRWIGWTSSDAVMRLPVLLLSALFPLVVFCALRGAGRAAAAFGALVAGAELALVSGSFLVGSPAPVAAVVSTAAVLMLGGLLPGPGLAHSVRTQPQLPDPDGPRGPSGESSRAPSASVPARAGALFALAVIAAALDPGAAVLPLGAALGLFVSGIGARGGRAAVPYRSSLPAKLAACACALLFVALCVLKPPAVWLHREPTRAAAYLQMLVLASAVAALVACAFARGSRRPARGALLGAAALPFAWMAIPALRHISATPLITLLLAAGPLAVLAGGIVSSATEAAPASDPKPQLPGGVAAPASDRRSQRASGGAEIASSPPPPTRPERSPWVLAACAASLLALLVGRHLPTGTLPFEAALAPLRTGEPAIRQVLAGSGLTPGALAHTAGAKGLTVVATPTDPEVGLIAMAAGAPSLGGRDAQTSALGERVLTSYGIAEGDGPALRWSRFRPMKLDLEAGGARPNIAIVSIDTLRADHLGVYGYPRATSPHIDRWASNALVYDRAMAAAPATAPSFSSLMTGRLPVSHGVRKNYEFLNPGNWTLAQILKRAGYDTAAFVSSFVLTAENSGLDLGFDLYDQHLDLAERNRKDRPMRLAPALATAVGAWLDQRSASGKPFFLWVHAIDPHGPYTPLPEFASAFSGGASRMLERRDIPAYQWLGTLDYAAYVNAYDCEILQTDASIGALLERLDAIEDPRGTIVIFVADHGEAFGEHGFYFEHGQTLHDEEVRVPLIVKDPRAPRAARVGAAVSLLDLAPTLLRRLGITTDLPFDGVSLGARIEGAAPVPSNWRPIDVMARTASWKVIVRQGRKDPAPVTAIYDLAADPLEAHPLPGAPPEAAAVLAAAKALFARDPLSPSAGRSLEKQQWESLDREAQENLRSLGYTGP